MNTKPDIKSNTFLLRINKKPPTPKSDVTEIVTTEESDEVEIIPLSVLKEEPKKKLKTKDCPTREWKVWRNVTTSLQDYLDESDTVIKSIEGCMEIQRLIEEYDYKTNEAISDTLSQRGSVLLR